MPRRTLAAAAVLAALLVVGCSSSSSPKTDPSSASGSQTKGGTSSATATTSAPAPATAAATPTPGTVPVDQIPPGRPASWIPAGMPTVAPWKEPGDALPMFTLAMYRNDSAGVWAMAKYYVDARNWAFATLNPAPFLLVCQADACHRSADMLRSYSAKHQHLVGGRQVAGPTHLYKATVESGADWIVRIHLQIDSGAIVSASGVRVHGQSPSTEVNDIYLRWSGRLWLVFDDALAPRGTE